jgi:hypothetical protein
VAKVDFKLNDLLLRRQASREAEGAPDPAPGSEDELAPRPPRTARRKRTAAPVEAARSEPFTPATAPPALPEPAPEAAAPETPDGASPEQPWEERNLRLPVENRRLLDEHRRVLSEAGVPDATRGRLIAAAVLEHGPATPDEAGDLMAARRAEAFREALTSSAQ